MSKRLKIIFLAACLVAGSVFAAYAENKTKIGIVDYQRVLESSSAGKAAEALISKRHEEMQAELKEMEKEVVELKDKLEREALVMNKETRDESEREFRIKVNDLKSKEKKYVADLKEKERELIGKIQKEVNEIVKGLGAKKGYQLILERRECGAIYFPDSIDLTDQIIEAYNKKTVSGG
jgi:outer membrane protein